MTADPEIRQPLAPEFLRRQLQYALQEHRKAAGLSPEQVGKALRWSPRKITRIEKGETFAGVTDVKAMLEEYQVVDPERIQQVVDLAVRSKRNARSPWAPFSSVHTPEALTLFASEPAAATIMKHELDVVPSLLQTDDYMSALLASHRMGARQIEQRIEVRRLREQILQQVDSPQLDFVIGEAVVSRPVGGQQVMLAQIDHLKRIARRGDVSLRLMMLNAGVYPMVGANFTIISFHSSFRVNDMVCLENAGRVTTISEDPLLIKEYRRSFAALGEICTPAERFEAAVDEIVNQRFGTGVR